MFISTTAPKLFAVGLRKVIVDNLNQVDKLYQKYTDVDTSSQQTEKDYSMFGFFNIPSVGENQNYEEADVTPGYEKTYTHVQYGVVLKYGIVAKEDELYGFLKKIPGFMTKAMIQTVESLAANVLNTAASTTGVDGVYLASLLHPALDGTHANTPTTQSDLCYSTLEAARVAMLNRKSFEGHPVTAPTSPILMYHPDNDPMVSKLMGTTGEPFSANNTINYLKGKFDPMMNQYLTDANMWALLDKPNDDGFKWFWRIKPAMKEFTDDSNDATAIRMRFRCSTGISDWRRALLWFNSGTT